jgi:adenylate cyclase
MKQLLALADREMDISIAKSEYKRIRLFIIALLVGLLIMLFNFFIIHGTTSFFNQNYTKFIVVGWFMAFLTYEIIGYAIATRYLEKQKPMEESLKVTNVSIEAVFPSLLIFALCAVEQTPFFLDSPLIFFYFILITISALNLEKKLALLTGLVSAGGYLIVTIWAINTYDTNQDILYFPPVLYIARSLFMMMAALGSVFIAHEIKKRTKLALEFIRQNNELELLFGQQVSRKVADTLKNQNYSAQKRSATILFMDIRNFSVFAEQKSPRKIIKYQNDIFNPIIRIINDHEGVTNQILGDGLMATFGAPIKDNNHAENALLAGIEIIQKVDHLSRSGVIPETRIGIGAHSGDIVMGNIGNELRKQFSISGTPVIIASRIEQLNKEYATNFLISGSLYDRLNHHQYKFECIGGTTIRNIKENHEIFKVV